MLQQTKYCNVFSLSLIAILLFDFLFYLFIVIIILAVLNATLAASLAARFFNQVQVAKGSTLWPLQFNPVTSMFYVSQNKDFVRVMARFTVGFAPKISGTGHCLGLSANASGYVGDHKSFNALEAEFVAVDQS